MAITSKCSDNNFYMAPVCAALIEKVYGSHLLAINMGGITFGRGGLGCLDRKQEFISGKLLRVKVHAAACFFGRVLK
jgi:hypothetical protein